MPTLQQFLSFGLCGLFIVPAMLCSGCSHQQMHQSMLLQENRRLENALYVTHAQLTDLKRENESLRQTNGYGSSDESANIPTPVLKLNAPQKTRQSDKDENLNEAPSYEMPIIESPAVPGTTEVPDSLKSSQTIPLWTPQR
jgi:hypothetical protein